MIHLTRECRVRGSGLPVAGIPSAGICPIICGEGVLARQVHLHRITPLNNYALSWAERQGNRLLGWAPGRRLGGRRKVIGYRVGSVRAADLSKPRGETSKDRGG